VNDSKATNVDSVFYALGSFNEPIVLIMGGVDKGNDYSQIDELVANKVKALYVWEQIIINCLIILVKKYL
jgi:UDP-N-acetylmuramoylalanine--D-glutamate ligase